MPTMRSIMAICPSRITLDLIDNFPSFERAGPYLQPMILAHNYKSIADIGGGAHPLLDDEFIAQNDIDYWVIDKSAAELEKINPRYRTIEADAAGDYGEFRARTAGRRFDLIITHMLLEHIENPLQAHRNFYGALNPGGRCVHIYPSPNSLPLALNRLLPDALSARLLAFAQPDRELAGAGRKFKAYYRLCGAPTTALCSVFEEIGYTVCQYTGYIGHNYYERCAPAAALERRMRKHVLRLGMPLTSGCLLVLDKPA
jgi:SAM-dependent methyltransferase